MGGGFESEEGQAYLSAGPLGYTCLTRTSVRPVIGFTFSLKRIPTYRGAFFSLAPYT